MFQEFQNNSDERVFAKIHQRFKPLVINRVNTLVDKDCEHLRDELESAADEALKKAVKTFDLERDCQFKTYAIPCIDHAIRRQMKKYRKERQHIKEYSRETFEFVVDSNSDDGYEIRVTDPFPFHNESILPELAPLCNPKELAILGLICSDGDIWHQNGNLNNAAIARKLGLSREAVRRIIKNLGTKQSLRSTISELTPR